MSDRFVINYENWLASLPRDEVTGEPLSPFVELEPRELAITAADIFDSAVVFVPNNEDGPK